MSLTLGEFDALIQAGPDDFRLWLNERRVAGTPVVGDHPLFQSRSCPFATYASERLGRPAESGGHELAVLGKDGGAAELPDWAKRFIRALDSEYHIRRRHHPGERRAWPPTAEQVLAVLDRVTGT